MKTKSILISKKFPCRVWEICEVIHDGTIEEYNRLIGRIDETKWGYSWSLATKESTGYYPTKAQALRALKLEHNKK